MAKAVSKFEIMTTNLVAFSLLILYFEIKWCHLKSEEIKNIHSCQNTSGKLERKEV